MLVASRREIRKLLGELEVHSTRALGWGLVCIAIAAAVAWLPPHEGLTAAGRWALFILVLSAGLWVTEAIPAFAVGLMVIGLEVAILGRPGGPWATEPDQWRVFVEPWGSPLIWLFFGGFVLARGISNCGLDRSASRSVLHRFGTRAPVVLACSMGITFVFSMFASNTATSAMMIAVLGPIAARRTGDDFAKALLLGVAFGANIGGMSTLIGTPPNAIAAGYLADVDPVGFARWMLVGLPPALVLLTVTWAYLIKRYPASAGPVDLEALEKAGDGPHLPRWRQLVVVAVLAVTVGMWLTEPLHGVSPPVVALVPVTVLTGTRVLSTEDIRSLDWDVLLLLAGGLALGVGVEKTGLAAWAVDQLPLGATSTWILAAILAVATAVLSNFMSNTAAATVIVPMAIALAPGAEPQVVVPVALAASAAMCLPVSTPPNAIAYASGQLSTIDFVRPGILIGLLGTALGVGWASLVLG